MKKIIWLFLFVAALAVVSCAGSNGRKCNGKKGVKTKMGLM
jgi:hypothetical protein